MKLKCGLEKEDVESAEKFLRFFLNPQFELHERKKYRKLQSRLNFQYIVEIEIHPAVVILELITILKRNTNISGLDDLAGGPGLLHMIQLVKLILSLCNNDFENLGGKNFVERTKSRFVDKLGFEHVLYEFEVASKIHELGKDLVFEDETEKKWPDLQIQNSHTIFFECKSLEKPRLYFAKICADVLSILNTRNLNMKIEIFPKNYPDITKADEIVQEINRMLENNENRKEFDETIIDVHNLPEITSASELLTYDPRADFVANGSLANQTLTQFKNPKLIVIKTNQFLIPQKKIINQIKKGYKQLQQIPDKSYGLICIDLTHYTSPVKLTPKEVDLIISESKKIVENFLSGPHYKKLSGVILTWSIDRYGGSQTFSHSYGAFLIPHKNSINPISEDLVDFSQLSKNLYYNH